MQLRHLQQGAPAGEMTHLPALQPAQTHHELLLRRARAADAPAIQAFVRRLSPETRRNRFFGPIVELSPQQLERLTSHASADDLNLLALDRCREIIGMAQCVAIGHAEAEFAVVVADRWQRQGVGTALCSALVEHARERFASLAGFILSENRAMLRFAAKLGFSLARDRDATLMRAVMPLAGSRLPAQATGRI